MAGVDNDSACGKRWSRKARCADDQQENAANNFHENAAERLEILLRMPA
jgi:hypothetical protein